MNRKYLIKINVIVKQPVDQLACTADCDSIFRELFSGLLFCNAACKRIY